MTIWCPACRAEPSPCLTSADPIPCLCIAGRTARGDKGKGGHAAAKGGINRNAGKENMSRQLPVLQGNP
jgi:hypothetical protein